MTEFCVCSSLIPKEAEVTLAQRYRVVKLPPDSTLDTPIQCHPDSIFAVIGDELIVPRQYYTAHPDVMAEIASLGGFRLTLSDAPRGSVYPSDCGMNAAVGRDFLICHPNAAAPELLDAAGRAGLRIVPVRQGYAGCSCLVTDAAVLTFDAGIARTLEKTGIPSLLLTPGGVELPGYACGFFGGACGFHDGVISVCGDVSSLPCRNALEDFARSCGYVIRSLASGPVTDVGGIRFYPN
ncbi:MAG: hypothetical protein IJ497_02485 [Clostridia bacterium]|nr:hypothetical protein [Clostridia bacterium]